MTTTTELRRLWKDYLGETARKNKSVTVPFPGNGRVWNLLVADVAGPAFSLLASIQKKHNYLFLESAGGTWVIRKIAGTDLYSLHSYGIAYDVNPSKNPYRTCTTNIPKAMRDEVLALRTNNGKQVFTWGGNWSPCSKADPMHFQIDCSPADLRTGIKGGPPPTGDDEVERNMADQRSLNAAGFKGADGLVLKVDGVWGANSEHAFTTMCKAAKATSTGGVTTTQLNTAIANHAKLPASATVHPHRHDEGVTGPAAP